MVEEKNFLQNIKLEISRNFKLVPYERLAFHKILGILCSETGKNILLNELERGPDIRRSAISILIKFNNPAIIPALLSYLRKDISESEKIHILDFIRRHGSFDQIHDVMEFIEAGKNNQDSIAGLTKAFEVLRHIGRNSQVLLNYLKTVIENDSYETWLKAEAVAALTSFKDIPYFEELLRLGDDQISYSVFKALNILINELLAQAEQMRTDEDRLYTYSPEKEDKIVLDMRVLLGKVAPRFDSFSNRTKCAMIAAMLCCNHREFIIYTMKSLTSEDAELSSMVLYTLHANIEKLVDPDKLFRSLIALTTESSRDSDLIVEIIVKYFSMKSDTRQFHILQDRLYGYIVVTLETYFETYRKDFMITDVVEKSYPESFQKIRSFILEYCTPALKKEIITYLTTEEPALIRHVLLDLSKWITYIKDEDEQDLMLLMEILYDSDRKSRENSASRIEDINFEKRYLRHRLLRLCRIIERLNIRDAASPLVNIYNYLKKYPDEKIMEAVIHCLSTLNYPYMLGEIEVLLNTGGDEEQAMALRYLSLFTDQRSLNILQEYMKKNLSGDSPFLEEAIRILSSREIVGNVTAAQIFRTIIDGSSGQKMRGLAVLGLGKCGFDTDIDYLNDLFFKLEKEESKDSIVRAMGDIIATSRSINRRQLLRYLQEYLKDPGIRVRIYSCLLLADLGNRDAIRSIRDMLIIKNKSIQRDILTILGDLRSIEFSFFLLSLLKEEYGISRDIIPIMEMLPEEDMKEIDAFVVNIFNKFDATEIEGTTVVPQEKKIIAMSGLNDQEKTVVRISVFDSNMRSGETNISELIQLNLTIKSLIFAPIAENEGVIAKMSNREILAYFDTSERAASVAVTISASLDAYNATRIETRKVGVFIEIMIDKIKVINEEIIDIAEYKFIEFSELSLMNRVILDEAAFESLRNIFRMRKIPTIVSDSTRVYCNFFEMQNPVNFLAMTERVDKVILEREKQKDVLNKQLEAELKKLKRESRSASTATMARELDNIGRKLEGQLQEIERYVQRRSTDRELIKNIKKMLSNVNNLYKVEVSRIIID